MKREARELRDRICRCYFEMHVSEGRETFCASAYTVAERLGVTEKEVLGIWEKEGLDSDVRTPQERHPAYCRYLERQERMERHNDKERHRWNYRYVNSSLLSNVLRNDKLITLETACKKLRQQGVEKVEKGRVEKSLEFLVQTHFAKAYCKDGIRKYALPGYKPEVISSD